MEALKSVDWKKVGIMLVATWVAIGATILTGGLAAPAIEGIGSSVLAAAATGAVAGATFEGVCALSSGLMSGKEVKDLLVDGVNGSIKGGLVGGLTGGVLGKTTQVLSKALSPLLRKTGEEVVEGAADTLDDVLHGGTVTVGSIATNIIVGKGVGKALGKVGKKKNLNTELDLHSKSSQDINLNSITNKPKQELLTLPSPTYDNPWLEGSEIKSIVAPKNFEISMAMAP